MLLRLPPRHGRRKLPTAPGLRHRMKARVAVRIPPAPRTPAAPRATRTRTTMTPRARVSKATSVGRALWAMKAESGHAPPSKGRCWFSGGSPSRRRRRSRTQRQPPPRRLMRPRPRRPAPTASPCPRRSFRPPPTRPAPTPRWTSGLPRCSPCGSRIGLFVPSAVGTSQAPSSRARSPSCTRPSTGTRSGRSPAVRRPRRIALASGRRAPARRCDGMASNGFAKRSKNS
mmetsp:Transcript_6779/g.18977  ORF Transcript_6779/g.18977 Transcript_6779/m.18977 type:complete len:229 (+) Transcript_6779:230-916(+)